MVYERGGFKLPPCDGPLGCSPSAPATQRMEEHCLPPHPEVLGVTPSCLVGHKDTAAGDTSAQRRHTIRNTWAYPDALQHLSLQP